MSKEITINEVFPKPLRIFCGFKRLLLLSSRYGKIEKKISKNVKITIDLNTIENLSI